MACNSASAHTAFSVCLGESATRDNGAASDEAKRSAEQEKGKVSRANKPAPFKKQTNKEGVRKESGKTE